MIEEIETRLKAIPEGEWREGVFEDSDWEVVYVLRENDGLPPTIPILWTKNILVRRFCAHAPADLAALIAEVRRLEAELNATRAQLQQVQYLHDEAVRKIERLRNVHAVE